MVEIIVASINNLKQSDDNSHDRFCPQLNQRIEVKGVRAFSKNRDDKINIAEWMLQENSSKSLVCDNDKLKEKWSGGICQIKPDCFDILFYASFFHDKAYFFSITAEELIAYKKYSKKQHRGGNMGQFHLDPKTIQYHIDNHSFCVLSYAQLVQILERSVSSKPLEISRLSTKVKKYQPGVDDDFQTRRQYQ